MRPSEIDDCRIFWYQIQFAVEIESTVEDQAKDPIALPRFAAATHHNTAYRTAEQSRASRAIRMNSSCWLAGTTTITKQNAVVYLLPTGASNFGCSLLRVVLCVLRVVVGVVVCRLVSIKRCLLSSGGVEPAASKQASKPLFFSPWLVSHHEQIGKWNSNGSSVSV